MKKTTYFEKAVRHRLIENDMNLKELCIELDVSQAYMYDVLREHRKGDSLKKRIAEYFKDKEAKTMLKIETKEQLQAIAEAFAEVEEYRIKESLEDTGLEDADLEAYTDMLNDIIEFDAELYEIASNILM